MNAANFPPHAAHVITCFAFLFLEILQGDHTLKDRTQAAFYVKQGLAREVLQVGEQPTAEPGPGEVRVHLKTSGVNPPLTRTMVIGLGVCL